jgi:hypothetical protein
LIGVVPHGVLDARVVDGEDDYVTTQWHRAVERGRAIAQLPGELLRVRRVAVDDLHLVPACDHTSAYAAAHVAGTDDGDLHVSTSRRICSELVDQVTVSGAHRNCDHPDENGSLPRIATCSECARTESDRRSPGPGQAPTFALHPHART